MELIFLSTILLVVLFFSLPLMFLVTRTKSQSLIDTSNVPPGKTGWPIVGESFEFLNTGRRRVPEKFIIDRMHKFSSQIFTTSLLGEPMAVFCGAAGNKFLFSNENKLVNAWWPSSVEKIFPSIENISTHENSTKLLPTFLKPEPLTRYVSIMDDISKRQLETHWDNNKEVLVFPLAKNYTFALACRLFLSIDDPAHVEKFSESFAVLASGIMSIPIDLPGTAFHKAIKASNKITKDLQATIKQRKIDLAEKRASPKQDILSHMLQTSDENGVFMNDKDIACKILGLLIGGHDTASSAITFIIKYLAELPHIYDEVLKEQTEIANSKEPEELLNWEDLKKMKYSWNVACEVMRPFGGGPRMCPGSEYARLEILVFMHNVVRKFKWQKIFPDEKIIFDPFPVPAKGLPVRLQPQVY